MKLKLSNKLNIDTKFVFKDKNNEHHINKIIKKLIWFFCNFSKYV